MTASGVACGNCGRPSGEVMYSCACGEWCDCDKRSSVTKPTKEGPVDVFYRVWNPNCKVHPSDGGKA